MLARRVGVAAIDRKREQVSVRFTETAAVDPGKLAQFVARERGAQFSPGGVLKFTLRSTQAADVLRALRELLEQLASEEIHQMA
jgi:transcription-repair coupling factor (superfamily II helicase)